MRILIFIFLAIFITCSENKNEYIYIEPRIDGFSQNVFIDTFYETSDRNAFIKAFDTYMKNTTISYKVSQASLQLKNHPKDFNLLKNGIEIKTLKYPQKTRDIDSIMNLYFPEKN